MQYRERLKNLRRATLDPKIVIGRLNAKLRPDHIVAFSLLAGDHCPGKGTCWKLPDGSAGYCYATGGAQTFPSVMKAGAQSFRASLQDDFVELMIATLKKERSSIIRLHTAGDFYNQAYINKWCAIAAASPTKRFYAYTKSLKFDFSAMPANVNIIQSEGGIFDHLIDYSKSHARIFDSVEELIAAGYTDCSHSDLPAALGATKVGLVFHGQPAQTYLKTRKYQERGYVLTITEDTRTDSLSARVTVNE